MEILGAFEAERSQIKIYCSGANYYYEARTDFFKSEKGKEKKSA